jgi:hypothetical protein
VVNDPSGFTNVSDDDVPDADTSTGDPCTAACRRADSKSGNSATGDASAVGAADGTDRVDVTDAGGTGRIAAGAACAGTPYTDTTAATPATKPADRDHARARMTPPNHIGPTSSPSNRHDSRRPRTMSRPQP